MKASLFVFARLEGRAAASVRGHFRASRSRPDCPVEDVLPVWVFVCGCVREFVAAFERVGDDPTAL